MKIELKSLTLENFKGIKKFTLEPGNQCLIRGINGSGKTTLMDNFLWILFGKDSQGKADFALKTLKDGQEIHNLEHSGEALFDIDGQALTLKKTLYETYNKKGEFSGHTIDYEIDGEHGIQKKGWDSTIANIIDENVFRLLTDPTYFNSPKFELKIPGKKITQPAWQWRRNLLMDVCGGDISDDDVFASDPNLIVIKDFLGDRTFDQGKNTANFRKKEIQKRKDEIPSRIDELDKSLADVSVYDVKAITAEIKGLDDEIQAMKDDTKASLLRKQKAELQAKLSELEMDRLLAERNLSHINDEKIEAFEKELRIKQAYTEDSISAIAKKETTIKNNTNRMTQLRAEYTELAGKKADVTNTCPTCGQALPKDQVDAAIKKHNVRQAQQLVEINEEGKDLKSENERLTIEIEGITEKGLADEATIKDIEAKIEVLKETTNVKPIDIPIINKVKAQISEVEKQLADNLPPDTLPLETKRSALQSRIAEVDATKKTRARIVELSAEEKKLATEYEDLERQIDLMDKFTVQKVGMLTEKINSKFTLARFKLFETQINGGVSETCVTLFDGVPYGSGLNTGAEINVGLDIVKTLSEHYGIKAPIFIDHAESVTEILDPGTQTIKLKVSEDHPKMEVTNE